MSLSYRISSDGVRLRPLLLTERSVHFACSANVYALYCINPAVHVLIICSDNLELGPATPDASMASSVDEGRSCLADIIISEL